MCVFLRVQTRVNLNMILYIYKRVCSYFGVTDICCYRNNLKTSTHVKRLQIKRKKKKNVFLFEVFSHTC